MSGLEHYWLLYALDWYITRQRCIYLLLSEIGENGEVDWKHDRI